MSPGTVLSTVIAVKNRDSKKRWIVSLVCAWLGIVVLTIAGFVRFKGLIVLALAGAVLIAVYWLSNTNGGGKHYLRRANMPAFFIGITNDMESFSILVKRSKV